MPVGEGWDVPQSVKDRAEFHWFHVGTSGSLLLCCLSQQPMWYVGHFWGGRMRKCDGQGCKLCAEGIGAQVRYVFSAVEVTTRQVGVMEVGSGIADQLKALCRNGSGLRGQVVEIFRSARSKHARMEMAAISEPAPTWTVTLMPLDLPTVLAETWKRMEQRSRTS